MRSRSSFGEVDSTDSSAAGLRVEETGQEPSHRLSYRKGRSSPETGLLSGPSTLSPEGLKEEGEGEAIHNKKFDFID